MEKYRKLKIDIPNDVVINENMCERHYCPYCGELMERHEEWDEYDNIVWHTCNCDKWWEMKQLERQIIELSHKIPYPIYEAKQTIVMRKCNKYE